MRQGWPAGATYLIMGAIRRAQRERKGRRKEKKRTAKTKQQMSATKQKKRKKGRRKSPAPSMTNPDDPLDSSKQPHGMRPNSGINAPKSSTRMHPTLTARVYPKEPHDASDPAAQKRAKARHGCA